jgi:asparagine synthase (glutamine-hydrolysing)
MLARLDEALRRRLPPRGDVAAFLSGGLDSSVVTMLASRALGPGRTLHCLSAGFRESRLDESAHARRVARLAGASHREIQVHDIDAGLVRRVVRQLDQPMADAATLPTWILSREAAALSPVALTGDGADALLAGDHWFRRLRALDRMERWPQSARGLITAAAALGGASRHRRQAARAALLDLPPADRYLAIRQKWTPEERLAVYTPEFAARVRVDAVANTYREAGAGWRPGASVDSAVRLDARHGLPEGLLMKGDKMGMAHGLETRSPFMDAEFAAWAAQLDLRHLIGGGHGKRLLKEAASRLLPRDLVWRRKQGLQVPMGRWLRRPLRDLAEWAFEPARLAAGGIFEPGALGRLKERFDRGPASPALDGQVWQIVVLQAWLDSG